MNGSRCNLRIQLGYLRHNTDATFVPSSARFEFFLFDKHRVVQQLLNECNFHIFYALQFGQCGVISVSINLNVTDFVCFFM